MSTQEKKVIYQHIHKSKKANLLFQKLDHAPVEERDFAKTKKLLEKGANNSIQWMRDNLIFCKGAIATNKCLNGHKIWCKWCNGCSVRYCLAGRCKCMTWE